jgi:acyl-CoA reductase-like NAD-dependent aldehyde dehydrogenase
MDQAADGATIPVHNPADGSLIGRVPALEPTRVEPVKLSLRTSGLPRRHR